ncbi:MAG: arsenosugar biosynthesis radical SAM (seleno)protein ArsS [Pseudomonadota bacterium]
MPSEKTREESGQGRMGIDPFYLTLSRHGFELCREEATTLQINVGFLCNQECRHCHLSAGPGRKESMTSETVDQVISYAERCSYETIDITGGAPELNPNLERLITKVSTIAPKIILRSNLSALHDGGRDRLIDVLKVHRVAIVASLPSLNESQTDSQRGSGVFHTSLAVLKELNTFGYGQKGSGLELNLVSNPAGAFLPPPQAQTEKRFREVLMNKWGIVFNNLFHLANAPLGRFWKWLLHSGNDKKYMKKLVSCFNPSTVEGLMCKTFLSISWDGYLYDCDFNLAEGLFMGGQERHVSEMPGPPEPGAPIALGDHCYACTAGAGFTCGGAIEK